jgi:hypothetical protein
MRRSPLFKSAPGIGAHIRRTRNARILLRYRTAAFGGIGLVLDASALGSAL